MAMQRQGPPGQPATGGATGTSQYERAGQQQIGGQQQTGGQQHAGGQGMGGPQMTGRGMTGQQTGSQGMGGPQQWTGGQGTTGQQYGAGGQATSGQGMGSQQGMGGQQGMGSQQGMAGQGMDLTLDDVLTGEMRLAMEDFAETAQVCEWCADQCIAEADPMMVECIRLCRDVADLARLNMALLARDSIFGPDAAETFAIAAEACADECGQHQHEHCQECARICRQAAESTREMLATLGSSTPMPR